MIKHISFSELVLYHKCSFRHFLQYVEEIKLLDENEFLCFGKALHTVAEAQIKSFEEKDWKNIFELAFLKELMELKKRAPQKILDENLVSEMRAQGKILSPMILPSLREYFGDIEVMGTELQLYENINGLNLISPYIFKGFIDLVIKTKKDNKIVILDYKTSTAGWFGRDRSDKMKIYQLIYYKYFYAKKFNLDIDDIDVYFCLLKRSVKKNHVEIFKVTSGEKRIKNALELLEKTINGIIEGRKWKNKKNCQYCPYFGTNHCV